MERYLCHATVRRVLAILCVVGLIAHATAVLYLRVPHERDFDLHRLIGTWFLNHQNLYGCGVCYPYMPAGAMYFSLLALVSRSVGFTLRYAVAMACLAMTCVWLHRMVKDRFPELARARLALSVATVMLALKFIMYDFDDGGPHTILLGMMVGGLYAVWNGRERLGAVWLGLAIALKVTPGLFLPFFLWKRQWRLAGYTAAAATGWILLPLLWMGPASWWDHQVTWTRVAAGSVIGLKSEYTDMNEDNIRNSGLNPALMRYLVTLSPDHPLRQNDPGYVPMLDMPPRQARVIVLAAIGGLLLFFGWHTRRAYQGPGDQDWARECSAVILLMLFLSPLTWIQHLPWLVPALYWIVAKACSREGLSRVGNAALGVWAVIALVLNYSVLGKRHYMVVLSYKPFAIGMFLLFLLVMVKWKERPNPSYFLAGSVADAK